MTTANKARSMRRRRSNSDGEERPGAELGDLQLDVAGRGRQQARAVPVALVGPTLGASWGAAPMNAVTTGHDRGLDVPAGAAAA
jgi:hypothetical protein